MSKLKTFGPVVAVDLVILTALLFSALLDDAFLFAAVNILIFTAFFFGIYQSVKYPKMLADLLEISKVFLTYHRLTNIGFFGIVLYNNWYWLAIPFAVSLLGAEWLRMQKSLIKKAK